MITVYSLYMTDRKVVGAICEGSLAPTYFNDDFKYGHYVETHWPDKTFRKGIKFKILHIVEDSVSYMAYNPNGSTWIPESPDGYRGAGSIRGGYESATKKVIKMAIEIVDNQHNSIFQIGDKLRVICASNY